MIVDEVGSSKIFLFSNEKCKYHEGNGYDDKIVVESVNLTIEDVLGGFFFCFVCFSSCPTAPSVCFCSSAGEVVSIAQLASLAGRPVSSCQGSKPVTFQLQGNKLTLSGAQIHQVPAASPRPVQGLNRFLKSELRW